MLATAMIRGVSLDCHEPPGAGGTELIPDIEKTYRECRPWLC
jgi:hypothetical protein